MLVGPKGNQRSISSGYPLLFPRCGGHERAPTNVRASIYRRRHPVIIFVRSICATAASRIAKSAEALPRLTTGERMHTQIPRARAPVRSCFHAMPEGRDCRRLFILTTRGFRWYALLIARRCVPKVFNYCTYMTITLASFSITF